LHPGDILYHLDYPKERQKRPDWQDISTQKKKLSRRGKLQYWLKISQDIGLGKPSRKEMNSLNGETQ